MKRIIGTLAVACLSTVSLGVGVASANEAGHARVDCGGFGNPGQAKQALGAAGRDRFQTPVDLTAQLGNETPGESFEQYCADSVGKP